MSATTEELIFLQAADLLEADEARRLDAILRDAGGEGEALRARARETLERLSLVLKPVQPSASTRAALLDRAVQERARARLWQGSRSRSGPPRALSTSALARPSVRLAALAASLLLAVAGGFGLARMQARTQAAQWEEDRARMALVEAEREKEWSELAAKAAEQSASLERELAGARQVEASTRDSLRRVEGELAASLEQAESLRAELDSMTTGESARMRAMQSEIDRLSGEVAVQTQQHRDLAHRVRQAGTELSAAAAQLAEARAVIAMLERNDLAELSLVAARSGTRARADLLWELKDRLCYMRAKGLPPIDEASSYALWVVDESGAVGLIGTFAPDAAGEATLFATLPAGEGRLADTFVTLEPAPVAAQPSGPQVMKASLERGDSRSSRRDGPYNRRRKMGIHRGDS